MSSAGLVRYYLDCPYEEKEHAKALGACWDRKSKKWYVPREKLPNLDDFNRWCPNGRFYLDCPFDERHEARSYGAQWDQDVGRWYVPATDYGNLEDFHRWLRVDPFQGFGAPYSAPRRVSGNHHPVYDSEDFDEMNDGYAYSDYLHQEDYPAGFTREASMRTASPPKKQKTKGSAADATTLRINDTMTVQQLQQECKHRGIKGFSGKNKDWLLDQLEVGSIWQFHRQEMAILKASKKAPAMKKKEDKGNTTGKNPAKNASHSVNAPSKSSKPKAKHDKSSSFSSPALIPGVQSSMTVQINYTQLPGVAVPPKPAKPRSVASTKLAKRSPDYASLPRVTSKLTVTQLSYELMFRQKAAKGMSSKNKAWFLELLGENSVWMTSPDIDMDLSKAPRVSKDMTVKELTREITARLPLLKGLSSKTKDDLVKLLGDGSIFTTYNHA